MKHCALLLAVALALLPSPGLFAAEAPNDPATLGPFGIGSCHINGRSVQDNARWIPQMESIGLHYYRACATGWGQVEPEQGKFECKALDEQMSYLTEHGFIFGALLNGNVRWNTLDKPGTLPVKNLPAWSAYVTAIAEHCRGKIRRWEVWNEPPNGTGRDQTGADYAKIVVSAYDAAKAVDPANLIGLATKSVHVNYLEKTIKAGAKDHFDYISVHPYEVLNGIADNAGTEPVFQNIVPAIRQMLAAQNPAKKDVPIIFTELGCDVKKGADTQAHALVKAYTMGIAQGVACIHWFEGRDGDSGPLGLLDGKGTPRPSYTALAQLIQHLGQRPTYLGWVLLEEKYYGFLFQGAAGPVLISWGRKGGPAEIRFGQPVQIIDPLTGTLTRADHHALTFAPILVLDVPESLVASARAHADQPLPWGGDFFRAKSVSLTPGDPQGERGLHTLPATPSPRPSSPTAAPRAPAMSPAATSSSSIPASSPTAPPPSRSPPSSGATKPTTTPASSSFTNPPAASRPPAAGTPSRTTRSGTP